MAEKNISKVVYGGKTLIDLTADTVTADKILKGATAHDKSGAPIVGACTFNADTSDATAAGAEILSGKDSLCQRRKNHRRDEEQWRCQRRNQQKS